MAHYEEEDEDPRKIKKFHLVVHYVEGKVDIKIYAKSLEEAWSQVMRYVSPSTDRSSVRIVLEEEGFSIQKQKRIKYKARQHQVAK